MMLMMLVALLFDRIGEYHCRECQTVCFDLCPKMRSVRDLRNNKEHRSYGYYYECSRLDERASVNGARRPRRAQGHHRGGCGGTAQ